MKTNPFIAGLLLAAPAAGGAFAQEKPNIIVMFVDDYGYNDMGFRNPAFETPNIDRFASENINFEYAYVPSPTCSPSRAGLLTGRHPVKIGFTRHINAADPTVPGNEELTYDRKDPGMRPNRKFLPPDEVTYGEVLKDAGYHTVFLGKWHLGEADYYPDRQGFEYTYGVSDLGHPASYFPPYFTKKGEQPDGQFLTDYLTDEAVNVIENYDYQKPLLLHFSYYTVHSPHMAPKTLVEKYTTKGYDKQFASYLGMVERLDNSLGRVLDAVDKKGIRDNTVVFFISDQGGFFSNAPLRGGKLNVSALFEGGARVPFFVRHPAYPGARKVEQAITTMDVFPTLLELAGASHPDPGRLDGMSLLPVIAQGKKLKDRPLFFYRSYDDLYASVLIDGVKYIATRSGDDQMYDLKTDPYETENVIGSPAYQKTKKKLNGLLTDFLKENEPEAVNIN